MPTEVYKRISAASTNEDVIKSSPGEVHGWWITNKSEFFRFVKLFDTSASPNLGTATPKLTLGIPAQGAANVGLDSPLTFSTGICIAMVTGIPIGATGAVAAEDLAVNIYWT